MPKISIITVCKNAEQFIEKTILSVVSQTFKEYEYIIVDGGSTDGTLDIIKKYEDKVDVLISEEDKGIYDAMNKGISLASGEYIIFLNAEDYFVNSGILERVSRMGFNAELIYGDTLINHRGELIRKPTGKKINCFFMFIDTIPHQNVLIKRNLYQLVGLHDVNYKIAGDYEFFLRAIFDYGATSEYLNFPLAVNLLTGVSADPKNKKITYSERRKAQDKWLYKAPLKLLRIMRPLILLFYKYPYYLFYIIASLLSKKYLKIEETK